MHKQIITFAHPQICVVLFYFWIITEKGLRKLAEGRNMYETGFRRSVERQIMHEIGLHTSAEGRFMHETDLRTSVEGRFMYETGLRKFEESRFIYETGLCIEESRNCDDVHNSVSQKIYKYYILAL